VAYGGCGPRCAAALRVPKGARPVDESALDGLRVWPAVVVRGTRGLVEVGLSQIVTVGVVLYDCVQSLDLVGTRKGKYSMHFFYI